jgi:hypothetical protein
VPAQAEKSIKYYWQKAKGCIFFSSIPQNYA